MHVNGLLTFARNTAHFSRSLSERYRDVGLYIAGSFYWIILQVFSWHCFQKAFASNLSTVYSCVLTLSRVIKQYDIFILLPYRPYKEFFFYKREKIRQQIEHTVHT